jgi:hypothetical protein
MAASDIADRSSRRAYRRLPGSGRKLAGGPVPVSAARATLWLGADHVLLRHVVYGMSESYKRFYFRDIQAIIIRRTPRWLISNLVLGCLTTLLVLAYIRTSLKDIFQSDHFFARDHIALGIFTAFSVALLVMNLLKGPSCVTHIRTAVQLEELASLKRLRKVRKTLGILLPKIAERQGAFDAALIASATADHRPRQIASSAPLLSSPTRRSSLAHACCFGLLLLGGAGAFVEYITPSTPSLIINTILLAGILMSAIWAVIRQSRWRLPRGVRPITWAVLLGYISGWYVVYLVMTMAYAFTNARARRQTSPFEISLTALRHAPGFDYVLIVYGSCSVVLGFVGLLLLLQRQPLAVPPPLPDNAKV